MQILVASCAGYSDAWSPFLQLWDMFWSDCRIKRRVFSDKPEGKEWNPPTDWKGWSFDWITDAGWIENLLRQVQHGRHDDTVMLFQEDFFLCYPIDNMLIARVNDWLLKSDYACVRLNPTPGAEGPPIPDSIRQAECDDWAIAEILPGTQYRVSCQVTLWKRAALAELCRRLREQGCIRIQDFEVRGQSLIDDLPVAGWVRHGHPATWPVSYQCSAIQNGKWMRGAVDFCKSVGIELNPKRAIVG